MTEARNTLQKSGQRTSKKRLTNAGPRISLAGRLAMEANGTVIDGDHFPGRQARLVFAYLAVEEGRPVPREELAEAVWAESPPATWEKGMTVVVSKLRNLMSECGFDGPKLLTSAFGCYRLDLPTDAWVDVLAAATAADNAERALARGKLEAAETEAGIAAALSRRTFLPGEDRPWVDERRRWLTGLLSRSLLCLSEVSLQSGRPTEAVKFADEAVALEPFRETGYRRLMESHAAAGNRAEALRAYDHCRRFLAEELGAYPSPETQAIYRDLLGTSMREPGAETLAPPETDVPAQSPLARRRRLLVALGALLITGSAAAAGIDLLLAHGGVRVVPDSAAVIDSKTNRLVADVSVGSRPIAVAIGARAVWVANADDGTVTRIDPTTRKVVDTIGVGGDVSDVAVGYGSVWVANGNEGSIVRIDPKTDAIEATLDVGGRNALAPQPVFSVAVGAGSVWATSGSRVLRIDPKTDEVTRTISLGPVLALAVGDGGLWVTTIAGRVFRVDPASGDVTAGTAVPDAAFAPVVAHGELWAIVGTQRGQVWRFDLGTTSPLGSIRTGISPVGLASSGGSLWIANEGDGTILRLDTRTGVVDEPIEVGQAPTGIAAEDGLVWVSLQKTNAD